MIWQCWNTQPVEAMTQRLTHFADKAETDADMKVKLKKTYTQLVGA